MIYAVSFVLMEVLFPLEAGGVGGTGGGLSGMKLWLILGSFAADSAARVAISSACQSRTEELSQLIRKRCRVSFRFRMRPLDRSMATGT